uniref:Capsid n=1 Tax=Bottlenose dolphin astrovirus 3 TaxID=943154 RepID=F1D7Z4_9VIRU|nr:capsid precursor [Bottlenose dolphin astrovirus 3]
MSSLIYFGGEDQMSVMAGPNGSEVTVKVQSGAGAPTGKGNNKRARGRRKRGNKNNKKNAGKQSGNNNNKARSVRAAVSRAVDRLGLRGPKPENKIIVTAMLGTIGGNSSGGLEMETVVFTNPVLAKEKSGDNNFGPLQIMGGQYSMWRLKYANLILTPMCGDNVVTGTVVRASLNMTGTPNATSWSALAATKHLDVSPGHKAVFRLNVKTLSGPRDGWWLTDTNEDGGESMGPLIVLHTLGKTMRTFSSTEEWSGPLFMVELNAHWEFANYQMQPGLIGLAAGTGDSKDQVEFKTDEDGDLVMEVTETQASAFLRYSRETQPEKKEGVGEVITSIVSTGVEAVSSLVPPPFGWLIKGGYWFIRKVFGLKGRAAGKQVFKVYSSYENAQQNRGCKTALEYQSNGPLPMQMVYHQMNTPNTGPSSGQQMLFYERERPVPQVDGKFGVLCKVDPVFLLQDCDLPLCLTEQLAVGSTLNNVDYCFTFFKCRESAAVLPGGGQAQMPHRPIVDADGTPIQFYIKHQRGEEPYLGWTTVGVVVAADKWCDALGKLQISDTLVSVYVDQDITHQSDIPLDGRLYATATNNNTGSTPQLSKITLTQTSQVVQRAENLNVGDYLIVVSCNSLKNPHGEVPCDRWYHRIYPFGNNHTESDRDIAMNFVTWMSLPGFQPQRLWPTMVPFLAPDNIHFEKMKVADEGDELSELLRLRAYREARLLGATHEEAEETSMSMFSE